MGKRPENACFWHGPGIPRGRSEDVIVVDEGTGLMWTRRDNGEDINWREANEYAMHLRLGGYADWRLPTIEELEKLYDPEEGGSYKIRKPFRLTDWGFGARPQKARIPPGLFDFRYGSRNQSSRASPATVGPCVCVVPENDGLFGHLEILFSRTGLVVEGRAHATYGHLPI